jgi:small conductance mechanosensitive channel
MQITPVEIITFLIHSATRIVIAVIIWFAGRLLIRYTLSLTDKGMIARKIDATVIRYARSALSLILNILLMVALLGYFGIETTSMAALLAGVGIAIGAAVGGLLTHFTAGIFMLWLRPFKVGDHITAGGVTGTVTELGLLYTKVNTPDNVMTMVGNNTIFTGTIQNFSANPYRRVQLSVQIAHDADHQKAITLLEEMARHIPNAYADPAPHASISELRPGGPVITLSLYCNHAHYWQVFYDGNQMIRETFAQASLLMP